jgi:hypothetical protein
MKPTSLPRRNVVSLLRRPLLTVALGLALPVEGQLLKQAQQNSGDASGRPRGTLGVGAAGSVSHNDFGATPSEPDIQTDKLTIRYTRRYDMRYYGFLTFTFWRPTSPDGWARLGDVVVSGQDPTQTPVMIVKDDPAYLAKPVGFERVWADNWDNFDASSVTFWAPVAPDGFVALGFAINGGTTPPDANLYRCVRADLVVEGRWEQIGAPFSHVPHLYHAFFTIKSNGSDPVLPPNTMAHTWWEDRFLDPTYPKLPRVPDPRKAGGVPNKRYVRPWLLRPPLMSPDRLLKNYENRR